jgi:Right handed beta helix region
VGCAFWVPIAEEHGYASDMRTIAPTTLGLVLASTFFALPRLAHAASVEVGTAAEVEAKLPTLKPGDELVLRGGTYSFATKSTVSVKGTKAAPIVIRGKAGERAIWTRADDAQNTLNVEGAEYLTFRGFEVKGGSACMAIGNSQGITIEEMEIDACGDVAIAANRGGKQKGFTVRKNHIHDTNGTGEGMYFGCNDGSCTVEDSLIELNYVHNLLNVEQGDGIELKPGSANNIVRDNVVHDTKYPCFTSYAHPGKMPNIIERNLFFACGDHGIQLTADAVVKNNIVLSAAADGIRAKSHPSGGIGNLTIVHNTVIKAADTAIRIDAPTGPVVLANNAIYALAGIAIRLGGATGVTVLGNAGIGTSEGIGGGYDKGGSRQRWWFGAQRRLPQSRELP